MSLTAFVYPLAILVWSVFSLSGLIIRKKYWGQFTPRGAPRSLSSFLRVIDLISILVRPFTLLLRLAANITAGHLILGLVAGVYQSFKLYDWSIFIIKLDGRLKYSEEYFTILFGYNNLNYCPAISYISAPLNLFFSIFLTYFSTIRSWLISGNTIYFFIYFSISGSLKSLSIFFIHIGYWIFEIFVAVIQSFIFCSLLYLYLEEHIITSHSNVFNK